MSNGALGGLSPWDRLPYYGLPVEQFGQVGGNGQIIRADPQRVYLALVNPNASQTVFVSTLQDGTAPYGLPISPNYPWLILTADDSPVLCQSAWYNAQNGPIFFSTIYVRQSLSPADGKAGVAALNQSRPAPKAPRVAGRLAQLWAKLTGRTL